MEKVDLWIVFDEIQFINKGWINRNRVLHPNQEKEWQYITVPLSKKRQKDKICDVSIDNDKAWIKEMIGKLSHYRKKAPYFQNTISLLKECTNKVDTKLCSLLAKNIRTIAKSLNIKTNIKLQSELNINLERIEHPGQWALRICEAIGAKEYVNPISGCELFNHAEFRSSGVELKFFHVEEPVYNQKRCGFVSKLSILDSLMWNGTEILKKHAKLGFIQ